VATNAGSNGIDSTMHVTEPLESSEASHWVDRLGTAGARLGRAGAAEVRLNAQRIAGGAVSRFLPQFSFNRTRTSILRALGVRIGSGSLVMGPFEITGPGRASELLSIGNESLISGPLQIDLGAAVRIGDRVRFGHHVLLLTIDHEIGPSEYRCGQLVSAPIAIEDGAWLGSRVTVLAGVTIGQGAVIGAGSVVTRDVAANTLAAGVPARFVRDLDMQGGPRSMRRGRTAPLDY
jgi:maltose O-acetyltransferase